MLLATERSTTTREVAFRRREVHRARVISWDRFDDRLRSRWVQLQSSNSRLDSPSLRPEFAEIVASVRPNAELAILESGGGIVGFFPYERGRCDIGYPLGGRLSDYHGVIAPQELAFSPMDLLEACGLSGWCFDHLVGEHAGFDPHVRRRCDSPYIPTIGGLEGLKARGNSKQLKSWFKRTNRLQQELGPLRLEFSTADNAVFDKLSEWKSAQYQRTGVADVFSFPWVQDVIQRIRRCRQPGFAGVLTALYAGDRLAAAHFGMSSNNVLQGWFPAYDVELNTYSPGAQMHLKLIEAAAFYGIHRIDMGRGSVPYKATLCSGSLTVGEGCVSRSWTCRMAHEVWPAARDWLKQSPLQPSVSWIGRATRKFRGGLAFK